MIKKKHTSIEWTWCTETSGGNIYYTIQLQK